MSLPVGHRRDPRTAVYDGLCHQATEGDWTRGFRLREQADDPWALDLFDPRRVAFAAPADLRDTVAALRQDIFEGIRPFFITDGAWDRLGRALHALYTDDRLCAFMEEHRGNLFLVTPHVQFHDLGVLAANSLQVRAELPKDNPFAAPDDPGRDQSIVANRLLTLLDHDGFHALTGLAVFEGLMLPIADVVTTISSTGSGRLARHRLGPKRIDAMSAATRQHLTKILTRGSQIVMLAPSGSQAKAAPVDRYSEALVVGEASPGTAELIVGLNQGEPETHRNAVAGVFLDCPSIGPDGRIAPQEAGVALCPDVWVPTRAGDLAAIMKATIRTGVGRGRHHGPEFRYGAPDRDAILRRGELAALDRARLTEVDLAAAAPEAAGTAP